MAAALLAALAVALTCGGAPAVRAAATPSSLSPSLSPTPGPLPPSPPTLSPTPAPLPPTPPSCEPFQDCLSCNTQLNCVWCNRAADGPCIDRDTGKCPNGLEIRDDLRCGEYDCKDVYDCGDTRGVCKQVNFCECLPEFKQDWEVGCAYCEDCQSSFPVAAVAGGVGGVAFIGITICIALGVWKLVSSRSDGGTGKSKDGATAGQQMQSDPYAQGGYGGAWTDGQMGGGYGADGYGGTMAGGYDASGGTMAGGYDASGGYGGTYNAGGYDPNQAGYSTNAYSNNQYGDAAGAAAAAYGDAAAAGGYGADYGQAAQYGDGSGAYQQAGTSYAGGQQWG